MTPFELEIIIHYYGHAGDFRDGDFSAPALREAINDFRDRDGLLEATTEGIGCYATYKLTERGKAFVEALCATPLPVQIWVMPTNDQQRT